MKTPYHESAKIQVTGEAIYVDDIKNISDLLQGFVYTSPVAAGELIDFDFSEAEKVPGVHKILSHKDIPGHKKVGAIVHDEPVLVEKEISYYGQALFLIAAENQKAAEEAMKKLSELINNKFGEE